MLGAVAQQQPIPVATPSVCDVLKSPSQYNGRIVEIRGAARLSFEYFGLTDADCGAIWLEFADQRIRPKPKFLLVKDEAEKRFSDTVQKNTVRVTLVGRLDGVDEVKKWTESRPMKAGGSAVSFHSNGFGHMGQYKARLVIMRVKAVE